MSEPIQDGTHPHELHGTLCIHLFQARMDGLNDRMRHNAVRCSGKLIVANLRFQHIHSLVCARSIASKLVTVFVHDFRQAVKRCVGGCKVDFRTSSQIVHILGDLVHVSLHSLDSNIHDLAQTVQRALSALDTVMQFKHLLIDLPDHCATGLSGILGKPGHHELQHEQLSRVVPVHFAEVFLYCINVALHFGHTFLDA